MSRNQVVLTGKLIERNELRHTPAGLPALNFRIGHVSEQVEAGKSRSVNLEIDGVALGEVAQQLSKARAWKRNTGSKVSWQCAASCPDNRCCIVNRFELN